jgi:protein TonB
VVRFASRTTVYAVSIGAHALLGAFLATLPPPKHRETVAISFTETKKAKPPAPVAPPPEPDPAPAPKAAPPQAKTVPPSVAKAMPAVAKAPAASGLDALPDFGVSLGGGSGDGVAIPKGGPAPAATAEAFAKTLARPAPPKHDECAEPLVKPKPLSRPTPAYTAEARAAGIAGKVRVEIVVDDQGHVLSARVIEGLGHGLDEAALAAARAMTFSAAVRCGKAVSASFKIGFTFSPTST